MKIYFIAYIITPYDYRSLRDILYKEDNPWRDSTLWPCTVLCFALNHSSISHILTKITHIYMYLIEHYDYCWVKDYLRNIMKILNLYKGFKLWFILFLDTKWVFSIHPTSKIFSVFKFKSMRCTGYLLSSVCGVQSICYLVYVVYRVSVI